MFLKNRKDVVTLIYENRNFNFGYRFSFDPKRNAFRIFVRSDCFEDLKVLLDDPPILEIFRQRKSLGQYLSPGNRRWGFGGALTWNHKKTNQDEICINAALPFAANTDEDSGSAVHNLQASLEILVTYLYFRFFQEIDAPEPMHGGKYQLFVIQNLSKDAMRVGVTKKMAMVTPELFTAMPDLRKEVDMVLKKAYVRLNGKCKLYQYSNYFQIEKDYRLSFHVYGDARCLHAMPRYSLDEGYGLFDHNGDSPFYLLPILASLSYLWDKAHHFIHGQA